MQTDVEILEAARRIVAAATLQEKPKGLPPGYHGPIDLSYIRPPGTEFPKMVYKARTPTKTNSSLYLTKVVRSKEEQDALPKGWLTTTAEIHALLAPIVQAQYKDPDEVEEEAVQATSKKKAANN